MSVPAAIRIALLGLASLAASACSESLYYTSAAVIPDNGDYVFMTPYFAEVTPELAVSIIAPKDATTPATVSISTVNIPKKRFYLYFKRNDFFSDTINLSTGVDGMLSSSDTTSNQQITAVLNELAQAAAAIHNPLKALATAPKPPNQRKSCNDAITALTSSGQYLRLYKLNEDNIYPIIPKTGGFSIDLKIEVPPVVDSAPAEVGDGHHGIVAFFPVPAIAYLRCLAGDSEYIISTPQTISLYIDSHFVDPQRDFLTNPQDTYTFNSGIIIGHKFTDTSPVKTLVDTVTAPIRTVVPSTTVTTTNQVVTAPGKAPQSTTTTNTVTGPAKGS